MTIACGHSRRARDGGHRRADAELARLVAGGRDDRARARCRRRSTGLPRSSGRRSSSTGRVERVAVQVGDDAAGRLLGDGALGQPPEGTPAALTASRATQRPTRRRRSRAAGVVAAVRSNSRPPTYGPRSTTGTRDGAAAVAQRHLACRTAATCSRRRACPASGSRRSRAGCRTGRGRTRTPRRGGRRSAGRGSRVAAVDADAQLGATGRRAGGSGTRSAPPAAVAARSIVLQRSAGRGAAARRVGRRGRAHDDRRRARGGPTGRSSLLRPGRDVRRAGRRACADCADAGGAVIGGSVRRRSAPSAVVARAGARIRSAASS